MIPVFFIVFILIVISLSILAVFLLRVKKQGDILADNNATPKDIFTKKYEDANEHRLRSTLISYGLVIALGVTLLGFTWSEGDGNTMSFGEAIPEDEIEIEPPQTKQEKPPPPPPPPPKLDIVEDEEEVEEEPDIDMEADEDSEVDIPEVEEEQFDDDEVFMVVEDMPQFPGGDGALQVYLAKTPYPPIARENSIEGNVWVSFVVDKGGNVTQVKIARGADPALDKAALNRVKSMPKWAPGKQRGKPVKVSYNVKIGFKLM
jgi:protein TonB